jgi:hypothetical protein
MKRILLILAFSLLLPALYSFDLFLEEQPS